MKHKLCFRMEWLRCSRGYIYIYMFKTINIVIIVLKGILIGYSGDSGLVVENVSLDQETETLLTSTLYIFIVSY